MSFHTNHNFHYLSAFALAQHSLVHFFQKGKILSESERDTLHDPLGHLLARLGQSGESGPATKSSVKRDARFSMPESRAGLVGELSGRRDVLHVKSLTHLRIRIYSHVP